MITTIELSTDEANRKQGLTQELKAAVAVYNADLSVANDLIEQANDKAEAASEKLNAVLTRVEAYRDEIVAKQKGFWDAQSEDWQYTPEGKAFNAWMESWGDVDATLVQEKDREKFEELDDGTAEVLDAVSSAPQKI